MPIHWMILPQPDRYLGLVRPRFLGKDGGVEGDRTPDLLIANETLYQLSYNPSLNDQPGRMVTPRGRGEIVRREEVSRQV